MVDITLASLLSTNPVTADVTGDEPLETVVSATSEAFKARQLSATPIRTSANNETLALTDQGGVLIIDNASARTVTIPLNSAVAFNVGATLLIRRGSSGGEVTIAATGGVTIEKRVSLSFNLAENQAQCVLHKTGTDTWFMTGELAST
ncbi:MAG: hypothetical protein KUG64_11090 [Cycloclasticus sp.]|nr:hypothetical protein [Cycloclasticus sp.]